MTTKTWVVKLEIEIDENSHPRKFVPGAIAECLNLEEGEDIIDYTFICLDWLRKWLLSPFKLPKFDLILMT